MPTLLFNDAGRASGSTVCNIFTATYNVEGDEVSFGPIGSTRKACQQDVAALEREYLKALSQVAIGETDGRQLVLSAANGTPLVALIAQ